MSFLIGLVFNLVILLGLCGAVLLVSLFGAVSGESRGRTPLRLPFAPHRAVVTVGLTGVIFGVLLGLDALRRYASGAPVSPADFAPATLLGCALPLLCLTDLAGRSGLSSAGRELTLWATRVFAALVALVALAPVLLPSPAAVARLLGAFGFVG